MRRSKNALSRFSVKPRRSAGYETCDRLSGGHCGCRRNGVGPCNTLVWQLQNAHGDPETAVKYERQRMAFNRKHGTYNILFPIPETGEAPEVSGNGEAPEVSGNGEVREVSGTG